MIVCGTEPKAVGLRHERVIAPQSLADGSHSMKEQEDVPARNL